MTSKSVTVETATRLLREGQIVAVPTETVYGLAGDISQPDAIAAIFATKQRPSFDPLIVHVASVAQAQGIVTEWSVVATALSEAFWPGPLTLVVPKRPERVSDDITAGLPSVGIRMPNHAATLQIIAATGPLAAPSANMFGRTSPTTAEHVISEFDGKVPVVDGGPCQAGVESTILILPADPGAAITLARPGLITLEQIQTALTAAGIDQTIKEAGSAAAPGQLSQHYQPAVPLALVEHDAWTEAHQQSLAERSGVDLDAWRELALDPDPLKVARTLYSQLRSLSRDEGVGLIIVHWQAHWHDQEWDAIRNRVDRAATFKVEQSL